MRNGLRNVALLTAALIAGRAALAEISPLSPEQRAAMTGKAWQPGCPVGLDELSAVRIRYWAYDSAPHEGIIVIHQRFADDIEKIFRELYAIKFPIANVMPYENFEVGRSAYSNATVGFYCRRAQDDPTEWSGHAYGAAIDLNPLENPFLDPKDGWWPETATAMAPREPGKGKVLAGDEVFRIFTRHGWAWGGFYRGEPDYMHFYKVTLGTGNPLERHYVVKELDFRPDN